MIHLFHEWSDWVITERGTVVTFVSETPVGSYISQERYCRHCGKTQVSQQHTGKGGWSFTALRPDRRPSAPMRKDGVA